MLRPLLGTLLIVHHAYLGLVQVLGVTLMQDLLTHVTYLAESLHDVLGADHILCDDATEALRPLLGALLVIHHAHLGLLQVLGVAWLVNSLAPVDTLTDSASF